MSRVHNLDIMLQEGVGLATTPSFSLRMEHNKLWEQNK
jgi:hypothetical protein